MSNTFGINPDKRVDIPTGLRRSGVTGGSGIFDEYFNQVIFELRQDHIWGTSAQVALDDATFYTDSSGNPLDKTASSVTINDDDKILIAHNATLAADLTLSTTAERLKIEMLKGNTLNLGDSGSGIPYDFRLDIDNARLCDIYTTQDYQDLSSLTPEQKRVVKNRGAGNKINLNGRQIFSGGFPIEIQSPVLINDPYVIKQDGDSYQGFKIIGVNDEVCLFTDWWLAWGGLDIVGDGTLLIPPVLNPFTGTLQRKVFTDDPAGRLLRLSTPIGATPGVDPGVHSRTSPLAQATVSVYTSSASNEISGITDSDTKKLKIGARAQATGLPSPTTNTTIISRIVHNSTNDNSIFLIDSETGVSEVVTASGSITIDMSGNSSVSHQLDAAQKIEGIIANMWTSNNSGGGVFVRTGGTTSRPSTGGGIASNINFDNSASTNPNSSKTDDDETRVTSYQRQPYLIL